jgi:hypothetical protein
MTFGCCVGSGAMTKEEAIERVSQVSAFANREGFDLVELRVAKKFMEFLTQEDSCSVHTYYGEVKLTI